VTTCAIRYRLDGAGPAAYLVECDGRFHFYARGELGASVGPDQLRGLLASGCPRWVPANGALAVDGPAPAPGVPAHWAAEGRADDVAVDRAFLTYAEAGVP